MSTQASRPVRRAARLRRARALVLAAAAVAVLVAMALDTEVVGIGSSEDARTAAFSPETYGKTEFPNVQADVEARAVDASVLAKALAEDKAAASKQYGVAAGVGPVLPVKFTGTVGEGKSGIYKIAVEGLPEGLSVRVQTGPAINGTDLRDATGKILFGQFKNQIEYQNAGAALNNAMKEAVLGPVDTAALTGRTVEVTGVFKLINPKNWLVTPVRLAVK